MLHPIATPTDRRVEVTIRFTDRFGNSVTCPTTVTIPAAPEPGLVLTCRTDLDALVVDRLRGQYEQATFQVHAEVGNTSGRSVFDVEVVAISMDADLKISGENPVTVAQRLDHEAPLIPVSWTVTAMPRSKSGPIQILFLVTGKDEQGRSVPTRECSVWIDVPEVGRPNLDCKVWTSVTTLAPESSGGDRRIEYDESIGDYEGERSAHGRYTVLTVRAEVQNLGDAQGNRVRATLLLPDNMTLELGESAIKNATPADVVPSGTAQVSWKVRPLAVGTDADRTFEVLVTAENGEPRKCTHEVTLAAAIRTVTLSMPEDVVGSYGQKVTVPVLIDETLGRDVFAYRLSVRFDPSLIRFVDATNVGSLTARGWNGAKARALTELGSPEPNLVRVEDYTTGEALSTSRTGALVFLRFEVVHNPVKIDEIGRAALEFVSETTVAEGGGRLLRSTMNSVRDDEPGDVSLILWNGLVTVSGDCVLPLTTSTRLEQNRPNPFNPSTSIGYELGEATDYTLTLHDALGRKVRVLEEGHKAAGRYTVIVEADGLPSGVYLYRLETPTHTETKRMVLSR